MAILPILSFGGFMSQEPFVIIKYPGTGDDPVVFVFTEILNFFIP
jgi:hypothetical protein